MQTAALFDLDGVVIDTEGQYSQFWKGVGEQDFPDNPDFAASIKGHTLTQILAEYYPNDTAAQQRVIGVLNDFEQNMDFPYIAGVVEFIQSLRMAGIPTAVVTSSNNDKMQCLYRLHPELPALFDHIFTAENARRSKPAPDCYIDAARHFGLDAKACYVFEDSISGLHAGLDSGATVVGLTTTNPIDVVRPLSHYVMDDFQGFSVEKMLGLKNEE